ncbi:MAG: nucleotidyltransferase domain-containing protein [Candidatus Margulisiibacteriota bacterium]|jgi:predicted nucleotidyltransferase
MDQKQVIKLLNLFTDRVIKLYPVEKVILFGSYAKGYSSENSDIDVAVFVDQLDEDFLTAESKLFKLRRELNSRIEPVLLTPGPDYSGFKEDILKSGKMIYFRS